LQQVAVGKMALTPLLGGPAYQGERADASFMGTYLTSKFEPRLCRREQTSKNMSDCWAGFFQRLFKTEQIRTAIVQRWRHPKFLSFYVSVLPDQFFIPQNVTRFTANNFLQYVVFSLLRRNDVSTDRIVALE
jgi:hypothetical protein